MNIRCSHRCKSPSAVRHVGGNRWRGRHRGRLSYGRTPVSSPRRRVPSLHRRGNIQPDNHCLHLPLPDPLTLPVQLRRSTCFRIQMQSWNHWFPCRRSFRPCPSQHLPHLRQHAYPCCHRCRNHKCGCCQSRQYRRHFPAGAWQLQRGSGTRMHGRYIPASPCWRSFRIAAQVRRQSYIPQPHYCIVRVQRLRPYPFSPDCHCRRKHFHNSQSWYHHLRNNPAHFRRNTCSAGCSPWRRCCW